MAFASSAALVQLALVALAYGALTYSFLVSDFTVEIVASNSHSLKPLLYKISGVWGNHEGSMLLWVLILAGYGGAVAAFGRSLPPSLKARVLAVHGLIGVAFLGFIILTSNPFSRLEAPPIDGLGLNPLLQDPGLAFHPPLLYLGYVGFSMAYSFAVAALLEGRVDAAWGRWVRPWTLASWMFLTAGIALGSWWAYYELGWGGWWFWDPVENASFMPWLVGTALLHSAIVVEKRDALKSWTIFLAILAFGLSILGTFVVRSGILTSVHSFASDPTRGVFILGILGIAVGGAYLLYAFRAPSLAPGGLFQPVSREGALVLNNVILALACSVVFLGTFYPLIVEFVTSGEQRVSVGPPYFNATFVPIMVPLLLAMAVGPYMSWKRAGLKATFRRLKPAAIIALLAIAITFAIHPTGPFLAPFAMGIAAWIGAGAFFEWAGRIGLFIEPEHSSTRLAGLPRSASGLMLAHLGFAIAVAGVTGSSAWQEEAIEIARPGESVNYGSLTFTFGELIEGRGPNYSFERLPITVRQGGVTRFHMTPERRFYPVAGDHTTEAAIHTDWVKDVYAALGEPDVAGGWVMRIFVNPLVPWIWFGSMVMVLGGAVSLTDRRYRLGLPKRAVRTNVETAAIPVGAD
jgi:cytochrome c-type biogenesis protein CcmF